MVEPASGVRSVTKGPSAGLLGGGASLAPRSMVVLTMRGLPRKSIGKAPPVGELFPESRNGEASSGNFSTPRPAQNGLPVVVLTSEKGLPLEVALVAKWLLISVRVSWRLEMRCSVGSRILC